MTTQSKQISSESRVRPVSPRQVEAAKVAVRMNRKLGKIGDPRLERIAAAKPSATQASNQSS